MDESGGRGPLAAPTQGCDAGGCFYGGRGPEGSLTTRAGSWLLRSPRGPPCRIRLMGLKPQSPAAGLSTPQSPCPAAGAGGPRSGTGCGEGPHDPPSPQCWFPGLGPADEEISAGQMLI